MRKWQQDLVHPELEGEFSDLSINAPTQEITAQAESCAEISPEKSTEITINDYHIAAIVFLISALVFCILKPAIVLSRVKDRPEESQTISYSAILVLSACTSALYLGLCFKLV